MKPSEKLNALVVKNAKPRDKDYRLIDGRGLSVLVRTNGSKLWQFRYRLARRENTYSIGRYENGITLAKAREEHKRARDLIARGIHPGHNRREEKAARIRQMELRKEEQLRQQQL